MSSVPSHTEATAATIANTGSLSAAIQLCGRVPVGLIMPSGWTAASLTFQISIDGSTYVDLYSLANPASEFTLSVGASRAIPLDAAVFAGAAFLKVRSGTSASPVAQGGERTIKVVCWAFR